MKAPFLFEAYLEVLPTEWAVVRHWEWLVGSISESTALSLQLRHCLAGPHTPSLPHLCPRHTHGLHLEEGEVVYLQPRPSQGSPYQWPLDK